MRIRKFASASAVAAMVLGALATTPVMAENKYTPINGTTMQFEKYLVMDKGTNVPNVVFGYTIEAGEAMQYEAGTKFQVLAGVDANKITITDTGFKVGDDTFTAIQDSPVLGNNATVFKDIVKTSDEMEEGFTAGKKYARTTATVDLSQVKYDEPGVYRYKITELSIEDINRQNDTATGSVFHFNMYRGIENDVNPERWLDVYVNDNEGNLEIAGYVLNNHIDQMLDTADWGTDGQNWDKKTQGYTNTFKTHDITLSKAVSGNQASHDKYFEFGVTIRNATPGNVFDVSYIDDGDQYTLDGDADKTTGSNSATLDEYEGKAQPEKLTVGADGTVTQRFYLQHNQKIVIRGIQDTSEYFIWEVPEDYKADIELTGDTNGVISTRATGEKCVADQTNDNGGLTADTEVAYTNTRDGVIPTGVAALYGPYLMGALGAIAMGLKATKKRK